MTPDLLPARMASKVTIDTNGCWIWAGAVQSRGYACLGVGGRVQLGHRVAYESLIGPIAPGMTIDHLCRVKRCLNPGHMEVVSRGDNTLRYYASRDSCKRGHRYTEANTYVTSRGTRECRTCRAEQVRKRNAA